MKKDISLEDVLFRTAKRNPDDLDPLLKYLDFTPSAPDCGSLDAAKEIAEYLRKTGSNDIATIFRGTGVSYDEVARDAAYKMGATGISGSTSASEAEAKLVQKVFEDAWDHMSEAERRELVRGMNLNSTDIPVGSAGVIVMGLLLKQFGGFATYRTALVVGNVVARSLLGSGLSFATNAALTRSIGVLLGPVGLIASGAWLAADLAGPAFRKTVPSVLYIAMLRQVLMNRVAIGVVGDGSCGKDAMLSSVFDLPSDVHPIAGSTSEAKTYAVGKNGVIEVINYPGFNDTRAQVNHHTDEQLRHTDVFLLVVDSSRGVSGTDVRIMERLRKFERPILVCLNKVDLLRDEKQKRLVSDAACERLRVEAADLQFTAFDPDPRLMKKEDAPGRKEALSWIRRRLIEDGKDSGASDLPL